MEGGDPLYNNNGLRPGHYVQRALVNASCHLLRCARDRPKDLTFSAQRPISLARLNACEQCFRQIDGVAYATCTSIFHGHLSYHTVNRVLDSN
jgi:hypothetical protein